MIKLFKKKSDEKPSKEEKKSRFSRKKQNPAEEIEVEEVSLPKTPTYWDVISPDGITIDNEDHGRIKQTLGTTTYFRPFYIPPDGYPRKTETNWLAKLTNSGEVDVMINVHKVDKKQAITLLQRQLTMLKSNLAWQIRRNNIDQISDYRTRINDTEYLIEEIQFSENDSFSVSVSGLIFGDSEKELNVKSEELEDRMAAEFFKLSATYSRVKDGFLSNLPLGKNRLNDSFRNIDRRSLTTFAPFISGSGRYLGGVPIGTNRITGEKEFLNSFGNEEYRPPNYNMGVFGIPGSGKSLALKLILAREMATSNVYYCVVDPEGEFVRLCHRLGGINLNFHEESDIIINPCAINFSDIPLDDKDDEELEELVDENHLIVEREGKKYLRFVPINEKTAEILGFFDIVVRGNDDEGLTVFERDYLEKAISWVIKEKLKISTHPDSLFEFGVTKVDGEIIQSRKRKPEPTISDIYEYLEEHYQNEPKAERLLAAIRPFLRTGSKPIFDGQTFLGKNVNQSLETARFINFNISQMEEGFLKPIAYHTILNFLWEHFIKNINNATKKKKIVCDEIWQFIDNPMTVSFFEKVARRIRKRHGGLVYASQDFLRLLNNEKARGIVTSTFSFLFMQQNRMDREHIKQNFDLTEGEMDILYGNPMPGEGIYRSGDTSIWLMTDPSEDELHFLESNQAVLEERLREREIKQRIYE